MREIKFRAWDGEKFVKIQFDINPKYWASDMLDAFAWEQCTGLKDSNGKEVYEGDVMKDQYGGWVGKVYYSLDRAAFMISGSDGDKAPVPYNEEFCTWVVIGNIHENPELLDN